MLRLHTQALEQLRTEDYDAALASLGRLVLALPSDHPAVPTILCTLAFVYERLGRPADAQRATARALALDPLCRAAQLVQRAS